MSINYQESIRKNLVITNNLHWSDKAEISFFYVVHVIIALYLVIGSAYFFKKDITSGEVGIFVLIFGGTQMILGIYLAISLFNWRKLIKVEGTDIGTNKELLLLFINGYYPGLSYEWDGDILIGSKPYDNWAWKNGGGLNIVILFKDEDVYINILSIYRAGPNPWMTFTNIDRAKEIGNMLKEKIRYTPKNRVN
jgi:hypothetical protein